MKQFLFGTFILLTTLSGYSFAQTPLEMDEFAAGVKLAQSNRFEAARGRFQSLVEGDNYPAAFRAKLHYNLGVCEFRLGETKRAVAEFGKAIEIANGDYEMALYALGMAQTELKNWPEAANAFHRALRLNDRNGEAWFDLAFVYLELNDFDAAAVAFEKSVKNKSRASAYAYNNLGVIFATRGDAATAESYFRKAIKKAGGQMTLAEENLRFTKTRDWNAARSSAFTRPLDY
jgi:tetratricopeptide (TPR) repeat protein